MNTLTFTTDAGDVEIRKHELPSLTEAELKHYRISRQELRRCFAAGAKASRWLLGHALTKTTAPLNVLASDEPLHLGVYSWDLSVTDYVS